MVVALSAPSPGSGGDESRRGGAAAPPSIDSSHVPSVDTATAGTPTDASATYLLRSLRQPVKDAGNSSPPFSPPPPCITKNSEPHFLRPPPPAPPA